MLPSFYHKDIFYIMELRNKLKDALSFAITDQEKIKIALSLATKLKS